MAYTETARDHMHASAATPSWEGGFKVCLVKGLLSGVLVYHFSFQTETDVFQRSWGNESGEDWECPASLERSISGIQRLTENR